MASCAKVLLSECVTIGLQLRKHATRCSQVVVWLVWMGLMSAFQAMCEIVEKWILSLFCWHFCWGQWVQFCAKFVSFAVGFGNSLAQGSEELWCSQNLCLFWVGFWHFSGLKCWRIVVFLKFVFLGLIFGISPA